MTRTMLAACAVGAFAASTTIGAQTPPPKPQPSTPAMASQSDKDTVTLTGCLKAWEDNVAGHTTTPSPTATTPSATGATAATKFMLTNVETDGATKPTTSAPISAMAAQHYVVMADTGVNLSAHLNHKVRITGKKTAAMSTATMRHDSAKPAEPKPDPSKPSAGIMTGEQAHKDLGTITASSVTMISSTCTGATQ